MNSNAYIRLSNNSNEKSKKSDINKLINNVNNDNIKIENPKAKLINALNNINDEINVIIDSKDKLVINNHLNLDCFIKPQSSMSSNTVKSPEKYINKNNKKLSIVYPSINKEEDFKRFIKTENDDDKKNIRKINKFINKVNDNNIKTDPKLLMKYINTSEGSQISKSKNSENNINNKINKNIIKNIKYINKPIEENDSISNIEIDQSKKLILYNLNTEDKILLKDMESKKSLLITDISSLNKKSTTKYNISITNFNKRRLLEYYLYLLNENEKQQNEVNNLEKEISELKANYFDMKKNELNKSKDKESEILTINDNKNISTLTIGKYGPISRYQNDLNFFEDLIIKMNDEIKNT